MSLHFVHDCVGYFSDQAFLCQIISLVAAFSGVGIKLSNITTKHRRLQISLTEIVSTLIKDSLKKHSNLEKRMVNSLQTCVFGDRILGVLSSFFAHLSFLVSQALKKKMYFMGKKVVYELYSIERFVGIPLWDAQRR